MSLVPKKRIENKKVLSWVVETRDRACLYGIVHGDPCAFGLDPHHIVARSQGGDDVKENLITLCRKHHDLAEANKITAEELFGILNFFYGYEENNEQKTYRHMSKVSV